MLTGIARNIVGPATSRTMLPMSDLPWYLDVVTLIASPTIFFVSFCVAYPYIVSGALIPSSPSTLANAICAERQRYSRARVNSGFSALTTRQSR